MRSSACRALALLESSGVHRERGVGVLRERPGAADRDPVAVTPAVPSEFVLNTVGVEATSTGLGRAPRMGEVSLNRISTGENAAAQAS